MTLVPVAVITGATRGIGRSIAAKLSREGMCCVIVGSSISSVKTGILLGYDVVRESTGKSLLIERDSLRTLKLDNVGQRHRGVVIDLGLWPRWTEKKEFPGIEISRGSQDAELVKNDYASLFDFSHWEQFSSVRYSLELLVNCAGVTQQVLGIRTRTEEVQRIMNINFMSATSLSSSAAKVMIKHKIKNSTAKPCIINVSSILGHSKGIRLPGTSIYSASKAAIAQYSMVLSQELARSGVRVNCVSPKLVADTDMIRTLPEDTVHRLMDSLESNTTSTDLIAAKVWELYNDKVSTTGSNIVV